MTGATAAGDTPHELDAAEADWGFAGKRSMGKETKIGLIVLLVLGCAVGYIAYRKLNPQGEALAEDTGRVKVTAGRPVEQTAEHVETERPADKPPGRAESRPNGRRSAESAGDAAQEPEELPFGQTEPVSHQEPAGDPFEADSPSPSRRPERTWGRSGNTFGTRSEPFGRTPPDESGDDPFADDPVPQQDAVAEAPDDSWGAQQPFEASTRPLRKLADDAGAEWDGWGKSRRTAARPVSNGDSFETQDESQANEPDAAASSQAGSAAPAGDAVASPEDDPFRDDKSPYTPSSRGGGAWGTTWRPEAKPQQSEPPRDLFTADSDPQAEPEPFTADPAPIRRPPRPEPSRQERYDPPRTAARESTPRPKPEPVQTRPDPFSWDRDMFPRDPAPEPEPEPADDPRANLYVVKAGDNYWTISRKQYGTSRYFEALARFNAHRIPDPTKMRPGMKVLVPDRAMLEARYPDLFPAPRDTAAAELPAGFHRDATGQPLYRIGPRDTLTHIAHQHLGRASRWTQIFELNRDRLRSPDDLTIGTVLRLPPDASRVQVVQNPAGSR